MSKTAKKQFTKLEKNWILYDVANSAYTLLSTALLFLYFKYLSPSEDLLGVWADTNVFVTIFAVLLFPILGTYADFSKKREIFLTFALVGIIGCSCLAIFSQTTQFAFTGLIFLIVYVITEIGYTSANVFYDSMLSDVTTDENMHNVSANGFAWGYICSCIPFALCLILYILGDMVFLGNNGEKPFLGLAFALGCLITAVWWFIFTMPLYKSYKQIHFLPRPKNPIKETFTRLGTVFKELAKNKKALFFLFAYFFYIDGVHTIIKMATAIGNSLNFDNVRLVIMLFVTQLVAFPCALAFGKLAKKVKCETLLLISILAYTAIGIFTVFLKAEWQCWILVVSVGMFQGGVQAMSRSYFTKLIPTDRTGEFFGIYDIFGKSAAILGLSLISFLQKSHPLGQGSLINISLIPLPCLFAIGLILFLYSTKIPVSAECEKKSE